MALPRHVMILPMFSVSGWLLQGVAFGRERFVAWRLDRSPLGPVSALGRFDPEGKLTIYTAAPAFADLVRVWHRVSDVKPGGFRFVEERSRLKISATPDDAAPVELDLGMAQTIPSRLLNLSLKLTLPFIRESELFVRATAPVAGMALALGPGRGPIGKTETGVKLVVAARHVSPVSGGRATVGGADCGPIRAVDDPPDWGELKMPRVPLLIDCRMMIHAPVPDLSCVRA
jgi:hypothetical protein